MSNLPLVLLLFTAPVAPVDRGVTPPVGPTVIVYRLPLPGAPTVLHGFQPPATQYGPGHLGVDLAAAAGVPVLAAAAGTVRFAGAVAGRGVIVLAHPDGLRTEYEPVRAAVPVGTAVAAGAVIGRIAGSHHGCPAARCLHWGARRGAQYLDPLSLLRPLGVVRLVPWGWVPPDGGPSARPASTAGRLGPIRSEAERGGQPLDVERVEQQLGAVPQRRQATSGDQVEDPAPVGAQLLGRLGHGEQLRPGRVTEPQPRRVVAGLVLLPEQVFPVNGPAVRFGQELIEHPEGEGDQVILFDRGGRITESQPLQQGRPRPPVEHSQPQHEVLPESVQQRAVGTGIHAFDVGGQRLEAQPARHRQAYLGGAAHQSQLAPEIFHTDMIGRNPDCRNHGPAAERPEAGQARGWACSKLRRNRSTETWV